jgi:hypothetical protein
MSRSTSHTYLHPDQQRPSQHLIRLQQLRQIHTASTQLQPLPPMTHWTCKKMTNPTAVVGFVRSPLLLLLLLLERYRVDKVTQLLLLGMPSYTAGSACASRCQAGCGHITKQRLLLLLLIGAASQPNHLLLLLLLLLDAACSPRCCCCRKHNVLVWLQVQPRLGQRVTLQGRHQQSQPGGPANWEGPFRDHGFQPHPWCRVNHPCNHHLTHHSPG